MKKIFISTIILALLITTSLAIAGCGSKQSTSSNTSDNASTPTEQTSSQVNEEQKDEQKDQEAKSDGYPKRALEMVVGGGPGGGSDTFARAVGRELTDLLGVPVNIVNLPGAAGAIASQSLASLPADGYTLMPTTSDYQINIAAEKTPNYLEQFSALALIHEDTYSIQVKGGSKLADIDVLIAEAKANPGKISIAGVGSKGLDELTVRKFEKMAGIDLNYVPYDETGKMHASVLGGHVDAMIEEVGPAAELIKEGRINMSIVFAQKRLDDFPDIPTTVEKGWDVTSGMNRGILIHKDTPQEIKEILEAALKKAYETERYQQFSKDSYFHLKDAWLDSQGYAELLEKEVNEYKEILASLE